MKSLRSLKPYGLSLIIILSFGFIPSWICQFFPKTPVSRHITISNFRYGKNPSVIRCYRGDTLHLTFTTEDTGHSFYLEEFDIDAKVSPSNKDVTVFKTSDPTEMPVITNEVVIIAKHAGLHNYIVSRSNYRCHVWCGPMHAFEQGKLIILPNTWLIFSLGCAVGIVFLWVIGFFGFSVSKGSSESNHGSYVDLFSKSKIIKKITLSRWPQILMVLLAMIMIYIVILTAILGTKVSGRNLGVLMMWAIWLFFLVAVLTPFFGRIWCTICPLLSC
jgi:heme/copper-type cytochrome/quinol oxidase subunit 2